MSHSGYACGGNACTHRRARGGYLGDQTGGQSSSLRDGEREPLQVVDDARAIASAAHAGSLLNGEQQHLENQARRGACLDESEGGTSNHLTKLGERDRVRAVADVDELVQVRLRAQSRQQPVAQRFELPQLLHLHLRALDRAAA